MGVARQTIRVAGMNETRPSAILGLLNEALRRGGYERFVTVCDVRVLPTDGTARLTICAAGHPLPLLVRANGDVDVAGHHGTVLGIVEDVLLTDVAVQMGPGDAMVLYTDGLIEWPSHEDLDRAFSDLLSSLAGRSATEIADRLQTWWSEGTGGRGRDDAAVVVLRCVGDPMPGRGGAA
jgi:sigma-B regulation protein RsbU (phosphoserine phosphatase)